MNATKPAMEKKGTDTAIVPQKDVAAEPAKFSPFVEVEKLVDKMADLTFETAGKAYDLFRMRGGEWGRELDDWFRAETEVLRPVPVEIKEIDENIIVNAAVPGFKPDEIEVSVKDDLLILSGETKASDEKKDENVIVREWKSNKFLRQFTLPSNVDANKVEAHLTDGILKLIMPKAAEITAKKIEVSAG